MRDASLEQRLEQIDVEDLDPEAVEEALEAARAEMKAAIEDHLDELRDLPPEEVINQILRQ